MRRALRLTLQHKNQPTSVDGLPPEEEGCPGLDGVAEDWAVVVRPGCPGHRRGVFCHRGHPAVPGRAGGTWKKKVGASLGIKAKLTRGSTRK